MRLVPGAPCTLRPGRSAEVYFIVLLVIFVLRSHFFFFFFLILIIIVRLNIIAIVRAIQVLTVKRDAHGFSGILSNAQTLALLSIKFAFFKLLFFFFL